MINSLNKKFKQLSGIEKGVVVTALIAGFFFPIKLSLGYLFLIPAILLWLSMVRLNLWTQVRRFPEVHIFLVFLFWIATTSIFGIDFTQSLKHFGTLFFFPLGIFLYAWLAQRGFFKEYLFSLGVGFLIAGILTLLKDIYPPLKLPITGAVSQAGQLGLCLIPLLAFTLLLRRDLARSVKEVEKPMQGEKVLTFFKVLVLPVAVLTLVIDLKRGPWFGILAALTFFCVRYRAKRVVLVYAVAALVFVCVPAVQERVLSSVSHFVIAGGRSDIWDIGAFLSSLYPLGIGFENSGYLRNFSVTIPPELKHFHNNLLNILVEGGMLSLLLYVLGFYRLIHSGLQFECRKNGILVHGIAYGLISWQLAGLVEYNFGDSAVVNLGYALMGLMLGIKRYDIEDKQV